MAAREAPNHDNNPYAKALQGLKFEDPVKAFFDFCREREAIRLRREKERRLQAVSVIWDTILRDNLSR